MKRAAHFLLSPELAYSPPNDAIVTSLRELGVEVTLFAPRPIDTSGYGESVHSGHAEYGYRWLFKNLLNPSWRRFDMFSCTTEDPAACAGLFSRLWRRPLVTLADEIRSGSYSGPRSEHWKRLCRLGMRRSSLTIVNDQSRVSLQKNYVGMGESPKIIVYPGCFSDPPPSADRIEVRRERGIPDDALLVCYSGTINAGNGAVWFAEAVSSVRQDTWFWAQALTPDPLIAQLLARLRGSERLYIEPERLGWKHAWSVSAAADIGVVIYLQDGPQFRNMGIASNRLCMFLAMGVPVIASRQPSFQFIEEYDCGILVETAEDFVAAVQKIGADLENKRSNAARCAREYIAAGDARARLRSSLSEVLAHS